MNMRQIDFNSDDYKTLIDDFKAAIERGEVCTLSTSVDEGVLDVIFTIGLSKYNLPELVMFNVGVVDDGFQPEVIIDLFTNYVGHFQQCSTSHTHTLDEKGCDWSFLSNTAMGDVRSPLLHVQVDPEKACRNWMSEMRDALGYVPLQVVQLIMPDPANKLPGEEGFNPEYGPKVTLEKAAPETVTVAM